MSDEQLIIPIPPGHEGTAKTVAAIMALANNPFTLRRIRKYALQICHGCRNRRERLYQIFWWCRNNLPYVHDPGLFEYVSCPLWLLDRVAHGYPAWESSEDCDGHTVVAMALAGSVGIPTRLTLLEDPKNQGPMDYPFWGHVYCEGKTEDGWTPCDSALNWLDYGQKHPGRTIHYSASDFAPDLWSQAEQKAYSSKFGPSLGYVAEIISGGAQVVSASIGARAAEKATKQQSIYARQLLEAETALHKAQQNLDFQAIQLQQDRILRLQAELESFAKLQKTAKESQRPALIALGAVGLLLAGLWYKGKL